MLHHILKWHLYNFYPQVKRFHYCIMIQIFDLDIDYTSIVIQWNESIYEENAFGEENVAVQMLSATKLILPYNIDVSDSVLFLENTMTLGNILKFIDDETQWILKEELSFKYGIDIDIKNIFDIMS